MWTEANPAAPDVLRDGLVARVRELARTSGDDPAVSFAEYADDPDGLIRTVTYAELDRKARAVAACLQGRAPQGSRVAVICPHEISYVLAFLGCLYAGLVAVPLPAPDVHRTRDRISAVLADADPLLILTTAETAGRVTPLLDALGPSRPEMLLIDELAEESATQWQEPRISPTSLAYLQYTSGSTGTPSGVRITHGNLAANVWQIADVTVYLQPRCTIASWAPFFHDMGLIMGLAIPLSVGAHAVNVSPGAFIQSPYRWLKLITDFRAVWAGGPNFAYDLCIDRITEAQKRTLDLSSLEGMVNASEVVRPHSMDRFNRAFASCGLREGLDGPAYGLAEATLGVTAPPAGVKPELIHAFDRDALAEGRAIAVAGDHPRARQMVTCGVPLRDVHITIVDPRTWAQTDDAEVGEIWIQGPNVADGYWRRPERTEEVFRARCTTRDRAPVPGEWLRTGDLGFLHEGLLFIAGRLKDLVIADGKNHDPADIEFTVQTSVDAELGVGGTAVFSVDSEAGERVVAVVEVRGQVPDPESVRAAVRRAVSAGHGVTVAEVVLTAWGAIPRTSSRKVKRGLCRDHYLRGELAGPGAARQGAA
ncbi:fatty acyl-AMP ligase [Streptomyces prasinopilosus]|uniref:Long chain fatty acid CoA FadD26/fatty acid CoA ligase FadD32 n=1 Tax=Streptomyces prasinopilosus TaxID=67344 RepID=A0A1G7AMR7_9ACTN|nr:fatty acyl-AMP ligase [Streptomyces prasinopilosus]SDE16000.1 long chain fatty acid CoA FadD26/fatty acid CoA ligase FadD32 [Streptomyces prasinopilosus]